VSKARPRIAPYPFTTLEPHLGIVVLDDERQFVAADLPGLIAGAHEGKGLGHQFLRHIERTRVLLFMVEAGAEDPARDLEVLEREVSLHSPALLEKPRCVVVTKADLLPPEDHVAAGAQLGLPDARLISAQSGEGLAPLLEDLWGLITTSLAAEGAAPADEGEDE
jgi:GTP-binding protein